MIYFAGFVIFLSLSSGICLVLVDKWMYKLAKLMNLPPKRPSSVVKPIVKMGLWQLRLLGVFHIVLGLAVLTAIVMPLQLPSNLFWGLVIFPILIWGILPVMIEVYYFKNKKAIKKASVRSEEDSSTY